MNRYFMKLFTLRTSHHQAELATAPRPTSEDFANATVASRRIRTYNDLRQQIHEDLRIQHPEWIEASGESPMCDFYEARLMELLGTAARV